MPVFSNGYHWKTVQDNESVKNLHEGKNIKLCNIVYAEAIKNLMHNLEYISLAKTTEAPEIPQTKSSFWYFRGLFPKTSEKASHVRNLNKNTWLEIIKYRVCVRRATHGAHI